MSGRSPSWRLIAVVAVAIVLTPLTVWASHRFNDVPSDYVFHEDIEWLADNGVTLGCNPPANDNFCPEEEVTRAEMAAFMRRLSEGQVVDARSVAGLAPNATGGVMSLAVPEGMSIPGAESVSLVSTEITLPADGTLALTGDIFFPLAFEHVGLLWTELNDGSCDVNKTRPSASVALYSTHRTQLLFGIGAGSSTWSRDVSRGRHRVDLCFFAESNDASISQDYTGGLTVTWGPGSVATAADAGTTSVAQLLEDHHTD